MIYLNPLMHVTVCNKYPFDFNIANEYMTGIIIGNPNNINHYAISITLGITAPNTTIKITDAYNYSSHYLLQEHSSKKIRTNILYVIDKQTEAV